MIRISIHELQIIETGTTEFVTVWFIQAGHAELANRNLISAKPTSYA
ncbi:MAG: hypothetical protein WA888_00935 [Burkholderiaceae bacterium]